MFHLKQVLLITLICVPTIASAQLSDFPMSPIQYPSAMSTTPLLNISTVNETVQQPAPDRLNAKSRSSVSQSLRYTPSTTRRKSNFASFVAKTRRSDPQGAAQLGAFLASTDVVSQIDQMMRPMGLRADNVADAYTLWWVIAWHAVQQRDGNSDPSVMRAVKAQATQALLNAPEFLNASDAQKQEIAEALIIQAGLIDGHMENAKGNKKYQSDLAKAVNQGARSMGLDLTKMSLTQDGFVPRSGGRSDAGDAAGDDSQLAANNGAQADGANMGDYALYAVAGTGLLAGMFALGKGFSKKG